MSCELNAQGINFSYGDHQVLADVSLDLKPGTFTAIIGPNGSGKTTLLKNLLRLLTPESGTVLLNGRDIREFSRREYAQKAGSVQQNPNLEYDYTVAETVIMGRYPHVKRFETLKPADYAIAREAMKRADIMDLHNHRVTEISGGEAQRVIIARALTQEPGILALDEPTNHLDIRHQVGILSLLRELCSEKRLAVVAILHDLNFALSYADQAVLLREGSVFRIGTPEQVLTREAVQEVYGVDAVVAENPLTGRPYIVYRMGGAP